VTDLVENGDYAGTLVEVVVPVFLFEHLKSN
jgi:hypothetical protein